MKENMKVRDALMRSGVRHWECASAVGVSEQTFVRWLRFPLSEEKEAMILAVIDRLARGGMKMGAYNRSKWGFPREVVKWAREDEIPLTEYGLRLLIQQGRIPVRKIGVKNLIFYPNVLEYLSCATGSDNPLLM